MKEIELLNKRKKREKHFLREDGTIVAKIYSDDIHFKKDKIYQEIDNTLVRENDGYRNKNNDFKVNFKQDSKTSLFKMTKDEDYLDFKFKNSNKTNINIDSGNKESVIYKNVLKGVDVHYRVLPTKVKETIILHNRNYDEFIFEIDTNLELNLNDNKIAAQKDGKTIFDIEKPYMQDSNGVINNNVTYELIDEQGIKELKLILDKQWLNDENTAYPVFIDPTITNHSQEITLFDTYIYPGDTGINKGTEPILKAGVEKVNDEFVVNRTLIRFTLPEIGTGSEIVRANLILTSYPTFEDDLADSKLVTMHRVTQEWDEATANWETMNNSFDPRVESIFSGHRSYVIGETITPCRSEYTSNITNLVKKWYRDTDNFGLLLKSAKEVYEDDQFPAFCSKNYGSANSGNFSPMPIFELVYRNMNGIEKYLDYSTQNITYGKIYANNYTGNITGVFSLGNTIGGKFPIQANLIYNTNDVVLDKETIFGKGYKLNFLQIIQETVISDNNYLEYMDEDGTLHYFYQDINDFNLYYDEDGLGYKINKTETSCILIDKDKSEMTFSKINDLYYLTQIKDVNNNLVSIFYDSNNNISKIIDANNAEISFIYTDNQIQVVSPNEITVLKYTNGVLSQLEGNKGTISFVHNINQIIEEIVDVTGLKLSYEYYSKKPYRLKKVIQYGLNDTIGNYYSIVYGFNTTTITDANNRVRTLIFNNSGNLLSISSLGNSEDINNAYALTRNVGDQDCNANQLLSQTTPVKYVKNYLKNSSFEGETNFFNSDDSIVSSISSDYAFSGNKSLKIVNTTDTTGKITQSVQVKKGKHYTFSGMFKNSSEITLSLSYQDTNGNSVVSEQIIEPSDEFEKSEVTIYLENNESYSSNLIIEIAMGNGVSYIDDIQLEEGEVANLYNIIENSDFSEGLDDWQLMNWDFYGDEPPAINNVFEVVNFNNNQNTALKVNMNPLYGSRFIKEFPISGRGGDIYNVSFWYKNEGIPGDSAMVGNTVAVYFKPVGREADYCIAVSDELHVDENVWQYFTFRYIAPEDYESIRLIFNQGREANTFYMTNLAFYRDLLSVDYEYDQNGNLISQKKSTKDAGKVFKYDENNQLISSTNPKGSNFVFEYDNNKIDRILNVISASGIANEIKYDSFGNPILTRISKKIKLELDNGKYRIRSKGTDKYIKADYRNIIVASDACSNTIWNFEKIDNKYKISYDVLPLYNLSFDSTTIKLTTLNQNNLFCFEKNENGSYLIKCDNNLYCKSNNGQIELTNYIFGDPAFEFYIETIDEMFNEITSTYTEDGKFLTQITDNDFHTTTYNNDSSTGLLLDSSDSKNQTINYTYNNKKQLLSATKGEKTINYVYNDKNLLSKIKQGNREYNFIYDNFLNVKDVKIGDSITLISNNYMQNNGKLSSIEYANNCVNSFEYDEFDRISKINRMDKEISFKYDCNGNIAKIILKNTNNISSADNVSLFRYDFDKRISKYINGDFKIKYRYDVNDNVVFKKFDLKNADSITINNIFDKDDQLLQTSVDNNNFNYQYDELGKLIEKNINNSYRSFIEYITYGNRSSDLIKSITNGDNKYSYEYDELNNITNIYYNNNLQTKYYYDELNELIKEENYIDNYIIDYNYDNYGNLVSKITTNLNTNLVENIDSYEYSNVNWSDQLTKYNNDTITYDMLGNPIAIGTKATISWINGRMLSSYTDIVNNKICNYEYNEAGIRILKNVNGIITKYYLENDKIIYEQRGNNFIEYIYDLQGVIGFKYNNNIYYYIKNLQQDIIGILDANYNQIVSYKYDSWGKILEIKDAQDNNIVDQNNIGIINPFRYRSYYYDSETQLYYLNNRYYNPEWGRFVNADGIIASNKDILSHNVYLYCNNNPITNIDPKGTGWLTVLAVVVIVKVAITVASNIYLTSTENDLAKDMFNKSMYDSNSELSDGIKDKISNKTQNSSLLKEEIKSCVNASDGKEFKKDACTGSIEYTTGDLFYSMGKVDYSISGEKQDDDSWKLDVYMWDTYDFTEIRTFTKGFSFGNAANDLGYFMQHVGLLVPYGWDVNYTMIYKND